MPRRKEPAPLNAQTGRGRRGRAPEAVAREQDEAIQPDGPPLLLRLLGAALHWGLVIGVWAALGSGLFLAYHWTQLPPTDALFHKQSNFAVTLVDRNGALIGRRGIDAGLPVSLAELPAYVGNAVIATEDRRFYDHFGLDIIGLARALYVNWSAGKVKQGGSTITQQLAKNLFLTPDRTVERKVQEALLAFYLENRYSKDEIITLYLNRVYFGAGAYGVDAAARRYFSKPAARLTLMEAAILAGLLKAPSRYSPANDVTLAYDRARLVLNEMLEARFISQTDYDEARNTQPKLFLDAGDGTGQYFIDWVMEMLKGYIGEPEMDIYVETTLDLGWQRSADLAVTSVLDERGRTQGVSQAAMLALTRDGAIRAMVGGRSYRTSVFNRATQAKRQPGSAFKPFVFAAALEAGMTPDDLVEDAPFSKNGWTPQNFDKSERRMLALEQALAQSVNTVAARLTDKVGPHAVRRLAERFGVTSELDAVPSLGLGTEEVTLSEITGAYIPFATGGTGALPFGIVKITGADGSVLYQREGSGVGRVLSAERAQQMHRMLSLAVSAGTGKRAQLPSRVVAGKTGTTQDFRDAWFIGYTGDLVAGVWVGNDTPTPMKKVTGGSLPADIWRSFAAAVLDKQRVKPPAVDARPDLPASAMPAMARATEPLPELPPQPVAPDPVPIPSAPEPSTPVAAPTDLVPVDELPPVLSQEKSAQADDPMATLIRAHAKEPAVGR